MFGYYFGQKHDVFLNTFLTGMSPLTSTIDACENEWGVVCLLRFYNFICVNGYVLTCVGLCSACVFAAVSSGWNVGIVSRFEGPCSGLSQGLVLSLHLNLVTV